MKPAVVLSFAALVLLFGAATASAQIGVPPMSLQEDKPKLSDEEQAKQDKLDRAYRAAIGNKAEQKPTDPWGNVRSAPQAGAANAPAAKPSQQPPKKLNLSTPQ